MEHVPLLDETEIVTPGQSLSCQRLVGNKQIMIAAGLTLETFPELSAGPRIERVGEIDNAECRRRTAGFPGRYRPFPPDKVTESRLAGKDQVEACNQFMFETQ
jgi:hypothetical protein